jgi:hypothetical protein
MLFAALDSTIITAQAVWQPVFAVIKSSGDLAGLGAVGERFVAIIEHDLAKAAADGLFAADIDVERLAWHIFNTRMSRLEKWAAGVIDWDQYCDSSLLGLEISLSAVLAEPLAGEALVRSGLMR